MDQTIKIHCLMAFNQFYKFILKKISFLEKSFLEV